MSFPATQYNGSLQSTTVHANNGFFLGYAHDTTMRTLSRPIKSSRSGNQKRHSVYMYSSQNNLGFPEGKKRLSSESDSMPSHNRMNQLHPLHNKFSASQPALNRLDVRASAFYADNERHTDITYPSLLKHSLEDLLHEPGPIPVRVPSVPTPVNGYAFSNGVTSVGKDNTTKRIPPPVPVRRSVLSCYGSVAVSNPTNAVRRNSTNTSQTTVNHNSHSDAKVNSTAPAKANLSSTQYCSAGSPDYYKQSNSELSLTLPVQSQPIPVPTPLVPTAGSTDETDHPAHYSCSDSTSLRNSGQQSAAFPCIPVQTPIAPTSKHNHANHSVQAVGKPRMTNDAVNTSLAPMVNNIPHTSNVSRQTKPNEPYRLRSLSYSGVYSSAPILRPRSNSQTTQPSSRNWSSHEGVNDASSSSDEDVEDDSPFVHSPIKPKPQPTESRKERASFVLPARLKTTPTGLSALMTTAPSLPTKIRIIKGTVYPSGGVPIPSGNDLSLHFVKRTKVFSVQDNSGVMYTLPYNSSIRLSVLYNPSNPTKLVSKGFRFRSAEDIMKQKSIPLVVAATKSWEGPTAKASVTEGQILFVRGIKTDTNSGYRLMVKTLNGHKKLLPANCVAHFSTAPHLIAITVQEFIQCKLKLPQQVVLGYPPSVKQSKALPSVVTLLKQTKECSVIATCPSLANDLTSSKVLEIPLSIPLTVQDLEQNDAILTRATDNLYKNFDACVTAYCSDSPKSVSQGVQSTFLKCLSSSDRSFGWELVSATEINKNPLLATPLRKKRTRDRLSQHEDIHIPSPEHTQSVSVEVSCQLPPNGNLSEELPQTYSNHHIHSNNINPLSASCAQYPSTDYSATSRLPSQDSQPKISSNMTHHSPPPARYPYPSGITEYDSPADPTSNVNHLTKQIQCIEAKCSSTDSQLVEFNRQFSEVKSTLSNIQQSMSSKDTSTTSSLATVQVVSVDIQPQEQTIQQDITTNGLDGGVRSSHDALGNGEGDSLDNTENRESIIDDSSQSDRQKRGYFGKRLNQAKAHFGKLLRKKQLNPTSPPVITPPAATFQCLNSIPELSETESSLELKAPPAHTSHRMLPVSNSPTELQGIQAKPAKPPIILPKPPSPTRCISESKPTSVVQQYSHGANGIVHNGTVLEATRALPQVNNTEDSNETSTQPFPHPVSASLSEEPINTTMQQPSVESHYERLEGFRSNTDNAVHCPTPALTNGGSPSKQSHSYRKTAEKPSLAPKPKNLTTGKGKQLSPKKPPLAPKPHTSKTEAKTESVVWGGGDDLDAIVEDIETWCSQIDAEVNQLTQGT